MVTGTFYETMKDFPSFTVGQTKVVWFALVSRHSFVYLISTNCTTQARAVYGRPHSYYEHLRFKMNKK